METWSNFAIYVKIQIPNHTRNVISWFLFARYCEKEDDIDGDDVDDKKNCAKRFVHIVTSNGNYSLFVPLGISVSLNEFYIIMGNN